MKVDAGRGKLYDAHKTIQAHWEQVADTWSDAVRRQFEERVWDPLDELTGDALRAMDRLAQVFNECRRECAGGGFFM